MNISFQAIVLLTIISSFPTATALGFPTIFDRGELQKASNTYSKNLSYVWKSNLLSQLTPKERAQLGEVHLKLPLTGPEQNPFSYYSIPTTGEVSIPILSVKFLDELAIAYVWLDSHGCEETAVSDYLGILRYQHGLKDSTQTLPSPLEALPVSSQALKDKYVHDLSLKILDTAIYFLMAHELGHVFHQHKGYELISAQQAQNQETEADAFALDLMSRISAPPISMVFFFTLYSRFEPSPGDFKTLKEYKYHFSSTSTHPISSSRLEALAEGIRKRVIPFARGQYDPTQWKSKILAMANDIQTIGRGLDDPAIRELQRRRSLTETLASVARACN